jgi:large subunit ribosomal protein L4
MGALRSALASKFADGKLIVVNAFDVKEPKSKLFREALNALKVETTTLLVEAGRDSNRNLMLSSRNLDGVELVNSTAVHPYHLLRYDRAIFSQPAIEALQLSLKNSASKRQRDEKDKDKDKDAAKSKRATRAPRRRVRHEKAAEVA